MNRIDAYKQDLSTASTPSSQFPLFSDLPDSCQLLVISFVASAPLERIFEVVDFDNSNSTENGTLTGSLPRVCRKFREYCQAEPLWQACLERALTGDKIWRDTVPRMAPAQLAAISPVSDLISALRKHMNVSSSQNLYQVMLNQHIRVRLPVFMMPMEFENEPHPRYQLHFFEPRYRIMMAELMREPRRDTSSPVFLHIVDMRGPRAKTGALVRVVECAFAQDGRCVAELERVGSVKLRKCWERPQSMGLYYGDGYRCDGVQLAEAMPHHWSYRLFS